MNSQKKEEDTPSFSCKNHSVRPDKELFRICPSKLSKRELEDLYFTLLENNLELKKINNSQQDKIKLLSTKVQRMTATQKTTAAKEPRDCCANTKALVNEHKGTIAELKKANERMSERIRVLNMRLCSAKQFLRRSPAASTSRCLKCSGPTAKNSTLSVMNTKRSDTILKTSVSCQCLDKDASTENVARTYLDETYKWFSGLAEYITSAKTVATATNDNEKESPHRSCDENKCQTLIEELKQKIVALQEELNKTHEDYTARITHLEQEVSQLQNTNLRLRYEHANCECELQQQQQLAKDLNGKLRGAEAKQGDLETQLTIEKRKVSELEANARAADMSRSVAATIERHLSNTSQMKNEDQNPRLEAVSSPYFTPRCDSTPSRLEVPPRKFRDDLMDKSDQKVSDDSGYTDANKSQDEERQLGWNNIQAEYLGNKGSTPLDDKKPEKLEVPPRKVGDESMDKSDQKVSDDSGYTDANKSQDEDREKEIDQLNKDLLERINLLQQQMENLRATTNDQLEERQLGWNNIQAEYLGNRDPTQLDENKPLKNNAVFLDSPKQEEPTQREVDDITNLVTGNRGESVFSIGRNQKQRLEVSLKDQEIGKDELKHFAQTKTCQDVDSNLEDETPRKTFSVKSDYHNSLQIPGPLPVDEILKEAHGKRKEKTVASKIKQLLEHKKKKSITKSIYYDDSTSPEERNVKTSSDSTKIVKLENDRNPDTDSIAIPLDSAAIDADRKNADNNLLLSEKAVQNVNGIDVDQVDANRTRNATVETEPEKGPEFDICEKHVRVCSCKSVPRREVSVYRTCSGSLRFKTTSLPGAKLRQCACFGKQYTSLKSTHGTQTDAANSREEKLPGSKGHTAFVTDVFPAPTAASGPIPAHATAFAHSTFAPSHKSRATSPDNTDAEISSLTDLPSEKDSKSPREQLSPGEDKATTTYTDSYTQPTTDYGSLSEGELPCPAKGKKLSNGEAKVNFKEASMDPISQRMEEALHAVGMELARCRDLLRAHRPNDVQPVKAFTGYY